LPPTRSSCDGCPGHRVRLPTWWGRRSGGRRQASNPL
jgi:hypothetical protein